MFLWVYIRTLVGSAAKPLLQLILLAIFLQFFGLPAIERYRRKEVLVVENKKETDGIPFPAVTISVGPQQEPARCYESDDGGSIERCIQNNPPNSSNLLKGVLLGFNKKVSLNLVEDDLTEDSTQKWTGRYYTLTFPTTRIGPDAEEDFVFLLLSHQKEFHYQIFVHDPKFFIFSDNPIAIPMEQRLFKTRSSNGTLYRLNLIEMNELDVPSDPCNADPDFNFRECVKESVSRMVFPSGQNPSDFTFTFLGWL